MGKRLSPSLSQKLRRGVSVTSAQLVDIRNKLLKAIDSLRIYHMGFQGQCKIEQLGKERAFDISGPLIA